MIESSLLILLVVLGLLATADGWLTSKILDAGGVELNPVMRMLIDKVGRTAALYGRVPLIVGLAWFGGNTAAWVLSMVYALVVLYNYSKWKKIRKVD